MSDAYSRLRDFLDHKMRMSHVYQPVMLETLLMNGGTATVRDIAAAILAHDESQIDYYTEIVKRMPGKVLGAHGIVVRDADSYRLALGELSEDERAELIARCRGAVEQFKAK